MKIRSVGAELLLAGGATHTHTHTHMKKLIFAFRNISNASTNQSVNAV